MYLLLSFSRQPCALKAAVNAWLREEESKPSFFLKVETSDHYLQLQHHLQ